MKCSNSISNIKLLFNIIEKIIASNVNMMQRKLKFLNVKNALMTICFTIKINNA